MIKNPYIIEITVPYSGVEKYYQIRVTIFNKIVFYGKIFVMRGQTKVLFNMTDILSNYVYNGVGIINPVYNTSYHNYGQSTSTLTKLENPSTFNTNKESIRLSYNVHVSDIGSESTVFSTSSTIYTRGEYISGRFNSQVTWRLFDNPSAPTPHFPVTDKLRWGQTVYVPTGTTSVQLFYKSTNVYRNFKTFSGLMATSINAVNMVGTNIRYNPTTTYPDAGNNTIYVLDQGTYKPITKIDVCPSPYYLLWIDMNGALNCQPFTALTEQTNNFTRNTRISSDDFTTLANQYLKRSWTLKSYNITDEEYEYMMSIQYSPWLILYSSADDEAIYVNPTDKALKLNTFIQNKKKPVYMTLKVDEALAQDFLVN